jgi:uncharacterized protein (TIGR00369 family)
MSQSDLDTIARIITRLPHFEALGLELIELSPDACVMALRQRPELIGDTERGVLHGGVVTTLLDSVCGTAVFAGMPLGTPVATLDLRIDYLRPATPNDVLFGSATVYKRTRSVAFVSGSAYQDDEESPVARCTASFMLSSVGYAPGGPGGTKA